MHVQECVDSHGQAGRRRRVEAQLLLGTDSGKSLMEPYAQGVGGYRRVQYFDKSRMEI